MLDQNRFKGDATVVLFIKAAGTDDANGNAHKFKCFAYKGQVAHWKRYGEDPEEDFFLRLDAAGKPVGLGSRTPRDVNGRPRTNVNPVHITHGIVGEGKKVIPASTAIGIVAPICDFRPDTHVIRNAGVRGEGEVAKARKKKGRTTRRWALEIIETRIFNIRKPNGTYVSKDFPSRKEAEGYLSDMIEGMD